MSSVYIYRLHSVHAHLQWPLYGETSDTAQEHMIETHQWYYQSWSYQNEAVCLAHPNILQTYRQPHEGAQSLYTSVTPLQVRVWVVRADLCHLSLAETRRLPWSQLQVCVSDSTSHMTNDSVGIPNVERAIVGVEGGEKGRGGTQN